MEVRSMRYREIVKEVKKYGSIKRMILNFPAALLLSFWLTPYLSAYAIKHNIKPNSLTKCMIPIAIASSIIFTIPNVWLKVIGAFGMHFFFLFDLADGQVARATHQFSSYGEQLDHLAHHCSHVFLLLSIMANLYQLNRYSLILILALGGAVIFVEYWYRDICAISTEVQLVDKIKGYTTDERNQKKNLPQKIIFLLKSFLFWFRCTDNYALFACFLIFADKFFGTNYVLILTYFFIISSLAKNIYDSVFLIKYAGKEV